MIKKIVAKITFKKKQWKIENTTKQKVMNGTFGRQGNHVSSFSAAIAQFEVLETQEGHCT